MATYSKNIIPTVSTIVSSTLATSLAPTAPLATTLPAITKFTLAVGASGEKAVELFKDMEEWSIQASEMNKLRDKVASLETDCRLAQLKQKEET